MRTSAESKGKGRNEKQIADIASVMPFNHSPIYQQTEEMVKRQQQFRLVESIVSYQQNDVVCKTA